MESWRRGSTPIRSAEVWPEPAAMGGACAPVDRACAPRPSASVPRACAPSWLAPGHSARSLDDEWHHLRRDSSGTGRGVRHDAGRDGGSSLQRHRPPSLRSGSLSSSRRTQRQTTMPSAPCGPNQLSVACTRAGTSSVVPSSSGTPILLCGCPRNRGNFSAARGAEALPRSHRSGVAQDASTEGVPGRARARRDPARASARRRARFSNQPCSEYERSPARSHTRVKYQSRSSSVTRELKRWHSVALIA